ncbi:hypothetical protein HDU84_006177 [Entophlyctis sp. JEL0112]|nr:hypothetical protein HDU84_006177 [Entophlyctis sp. JEL0112]
MPARPAALLRRPCRRSVRRRQRREFNARYASSSLRPKCVAPLSCLGSVCQPGYVTQQDLSLLAGVNYLVCSSDADVRASPIPFRVLADGTPDVSDYPALVNCDGSSFGFDWFNVNKQNEYMCVNPSLFNCHTPGSSQFYYNDSLNACPQGFSCYAWNPQAGDNTPLTGSYCRQKCLQDSDCFPGLMCATEGYCILDKSSLLVYLGS